MDIAMVAVRDAFRKIIHNNCVDPDKRDIIVNDLVSSLQSDQKLAFFVRELLPKEDKPRWFLFGRK